MKNTHKVLFLITLIFIFLFCSNSMVCFAKDVKGTEYEFEVYTLKELEIIDYYSNGMHEPENSLQKQK